MFKPEIKVFYNLDKGFLAEIYQGGTRSYDYFGMWMFGFETLEEWFTYILMDLNDKYNLTDVSE